MDIGKIKKWWWKHKFLGALRRQKPEVFISGFFEEESVVFVVSCNHDDFFRIYLSEYELALLETMMSDGEFIVYAGRVVNSVVEYVLHSHKKMKGIEFWSDY
ncbi:hypothetical protein [Streptococcus mutans]|uniref:hypothetical protein n=1 Tax=Streptococcus mutans TaxID=1309 RepID=UPI0002B5182E|nr:hypothetical protein [Streptococcus mutans]EMB68646.1 hypothetical protein SMU29_03717 [Streptococcus mutans 2ST1]